jgi:hypothetical protein
VSLPLPRLDDRTFADLVDELRALIPTYNPEWTNYNPSDPGITLIELFAWLAEMLIYRADQVPDRHRLVFLRLLNGPDWTPTLPVDDEVDATLTALRSRFRAVTIEDYEALVHEASPAVARVLALPRRDLGGADEEARLAPQPGYVSIVVLPALDVAEADEEALRDTVREYLEPRRLLTTQHVIAEPVWAPVAAEVLVARRPDVPEARARDAVVATLDRFLDPRIGGAKGDGWPFGRDVFVSELYAQLEALAEVDYVADIFVTSSCPGGEPRCAEAQQLWDGQGDEVGLALQPHHLPRSAIDPADVIVSASFVPVRATVAVTPVDGVTPAAVRQGVKAGLRSLFHPLGNGPTGAAPWSIGSDRALASLRQQAVVKDVAKVVSVDFAGDPAHVTTDERNVVNVQIAEHELVDLQAEVVLQ